MSLLCASTAQRVTHSSRRCAATSEASAEMPGGTLDKLE